MNAYGFYVKDNKTGKVLLVGSSFNGLYHIRAAPKVTEKIVFYGEKTTEDVWHTRLGHPSYHVFRMILNKHHLPISGEIDSNKTCHVCPMGKSCRLPFSNRTSHTQKPLELLHLDLWGTAPVLSNFGYRFYLSIVDDHTR